MGDIEGEVEKAQKSAQRAATMRGLLIQAWDLEIARLQRQQDVLRNLEENEQKIVEAQRKAKIAAAQVGASRDKAAGFVTDDNAVLRIQTEGTLQDLKTQLGTAAVEADRTRRLATEAANKFEDVFRTAPPEDPEGRYPRQQPDVVAAKAAKDDAEAAAEKAQQNYDAAKSIVAAAEKEAADKFEVDVRKQIEQSAADDTQLVGQMLDYLDGVRENNAGKLSRTGEDVFTELTKIVTDSIPDSEQLPRIRAQFELLRTSNEGRDQAFFQFITESLAHNRATEARIQSLVQEMRAIREKAQSGG
jgi:hypothetical protein